MYMAFKHAHMTFAMLSGIFFLVRGVWMLVDSPMLAQRWVKIVPHIIDTLLLVCAIVLMFQIQQYPLTHDWLTAKVVALVLYIIAGTIAIKRGKTKTVRVAAFGFALLCFVYMMSVAFAHHPLGALARFV
ncbi:MAG: SirB2 family protein [Ketobacteraceae bacterium]|nr:SirB2 family protein [Ketobacteraceae bacterium]